MKPKKASQQNPQADLFRPELCDMIDPAHSLIKLSLVVNWEKLDQTFGKKFSPEKGRPAIITRLMIALHYFKFTFDLSDDDVLQCWIENPNWQYVSGMKYFEYKLPINPSSMTRRRKRIGEAGAEELLKQTIEAGLKLKAIKTTQLKRVNVDTTVQEKDIRFPTDARLYDRARVRLVTHLLKTLFQDRRGQAYKAIIYQRSLFGVMGTAGFIPFMGREPVGATVIMVWFSISASIIPDQNRYFSPNLTMECR